MSLKTILTISFLSLLLGSSASAVEQGSFEEQANRYKWMCVPEEGLPNVLIIGDSISIGYTLGVRERLQGVANVYRPVIESGAKKDTPENGGDTSRGLPRLARWIDYAEKWDVIHFNWGLHDLRRNSATDREGSPDLPNNINVAEYEKNLQKIVDILKATDAKLIFALTTPYPEGVTPCRLPEDVARYNEAAIRVMKKNGVEINDLYNLTKDRLGGIQQPKNVHFNAAGNKLLAEAVSVKISSELNEEDR